MNQKLDSMMTSWRCPREMASSAPHIIPDRRQCRRSGYGLARGLTAALSRCWKTEERFRSAPASQSEGHEPGRRAGYRTICTLDRHCRVGPRSVPRWHIGIVIALLAGVDPGAGMT